MKSGTPALQIPEILEQVLRQLVPLDFQDILDEADHFWDDEFEDRIPEGRQALLNMSLACRFFSELALDMLWWYLDDLKHLLRLIPGFVVNDGGVATIEGPISPEDLKIFDTYLQRVRCYKMEDAGVLHPDLVATVLKANGRKHLLPQLQYFIVRHSNANLGLFAPPTLTGVSIKTGFNNPTKGKTLKEINAYIQVISQRCPTITFLEINSSLDITCLPAIGRLAYLKHLYLGRKWLRQDITIDPCYILSLESHASLRTLELVDGISFAAPSTIDRNRTTFPALDHLSLTTGGPTIKTLANLLRFISAPKLRSLSINFKRGDHPLDGSEKDHWLAFFAVLPEMTCKNLQYLDLTSSWDHPLSHWSAVEMHISSVTAFDELGLLSNFSVMIPVFAELSVADIEKIERRWPDNADQIIQCLQNARVEGSDDSEDSV